MKPPKRQKPTPEKIQKWLKQHGHKSADQTDKKACLSCIRMIYAVLFSLPFWVFIFLVTR